MFCGGTEHLQRPNQTNRPIFDRHVTTFLSCNSKKISIPTEGSEAKISEGRGDSSLAFFPEGGKK